MNKIDRDALLKENRDLKVKIDKYKHSYNEYVDKYNKLLDTPEEDESKARNTLALHAMQGYIQYLGWDPDGYLDGKDIPNKVLISRSAYAIADAMLEEAKRIK